MSKYTVELHEIVSEGYEIFDFEYDFYVDDEEVKKQWEAKFIDRYLFHEVGFETVYKFKHYLREKLNRIAPYYKQLYATELACKDINFMLNKDLVEEFKRDVESTSESTDLGTNDITTNYTGDTTTTDKLKESAIANGNSSLNLEEGYLTGVNENVNTVDDTNKTDSSTSYENNEVRDNNLTETTQLISKGNIGVTSSAHLLKQWRSVLINIDELIINECADLFLALL